MTMSLIVANVEAVDDNGFTRGFIVPEGTTGDLSLVAVDHVDIPATEDEAEWWQGLRAAAAHAGWAVESPISHDGATVSAPVVKVDDQDDDQDDRCYCGHPECGSC